MADQGNGAGEGDAARTMRERRDRLASLRSRHQDLGPAAGPTPRSGPRAGGAPREGVGGGAGGVFGPQAPGRQILLKAYRLLTQGAPGAETIPGTPFTQGGVERLMTLLGQRAARPDAPGAKVAQGALRFLEAKDGEAAAGGASLEKLQLLARRTEALRTRRGAGL